MNSQQVFEKMPKLVQKTIGDVQKKLTVWEGEARKAITDTYKKVLKNKSFQKVETTLDQWQAKYAQKVDLAPYRKKVEKFRSDFQDRAFDTIGVASKNDIRDINRKLNNIKAELRKIGGGKTTTPATKRK